MKADNDWLFTVCVVLHLDTESESKEICISLRISMFHKPNINHNTWRHRYSFIASQIPPSYTWMSVREVDWDVWCAGPGHGGDSEAAGLDLRQHPGGPGRVRREGNVGCSDYLASSWALCHRSRFAHWENFKSNLIGKFIDHSIWKFGTKILF